MRRVESLRIFGSFEKIGTYELPIKVDGEAVGFSIDYFEFPNNVRYSVLFLENPQDGILVRINSECMWGRFGSLQCDCNWQFEESKRRIAAEGGGIIIFAHDQIGKGIGLKSHALVNAEAGKRAKGEPLYTQDICYDGFEKLGFKTECRNFDDVAQILKHYGIKSVRLLTNSPLKMEQMAKNGIEVEREKIVPPVDKYNKAELKFKIEKGGHLFSI